MMRKLTLDIFNELLKQAVVKPRLKKELRFVKSTSNLAEEDWQDLELFPITDRTGNNGVLLIELEDEFFVVPYEISKGLTDKATGRSKPVICDFCLTWQAGNNAARISFRRDLKSLNSVTFLCCADLACSSNVRGKTHAALNSRSQLREDMTDQQRIARLKNRLQEFIEDMKLRPLATE